MIWDTKNKQINQLRDKPDIHIHNTDIHIYNTDI